MLYGIYYLTCSSEVYWVCSNQHQTFQEKYGEHYFNISLNSSYKITNSHPSIPIQPGDIIYVWLTKVLFVSHIRTVPLLMNSYTLVASLALTMDPQYTSRPCLIMSKASSVDCIDIYIIHHKKQRCSSIQQWQVCARLKHCGKQSWNIQSWHLPYSTRLHKCSIFFAMSDPYAMNIHQHKPTLLEHSV